MEQPPGRSTGEAQDLWQLLMCHQRLQCGDVHTQARCVFKAQQGANAGRTPESRTALGAAPPSRAATAPDPATCCPALCTSHPWPHACPAGERCARAHKRGCQAARLLKLQLWRLAERDPVYCCRKHFAARTCFLLPLCKYNTQLNSTKHNHRQATGGKHGHAHNCCPTARAQMYMSHLLSSARRCGCCLRHAATR